MMREDSIFRLITLLCYVVDYEMLEVSSDDEGGIIYLG